MGPHPVVWFEIYVDDMERAKQFYASVLQTEFERIESPGIEMWSFTTNDESMTTYGSSGALVKMEGYKAGGNSTLVYFACENCAAETSRVEAAGGKVIRQKFSIGQFGFIALASDAEGNIFGLHSLE